MREYISLLRGVNVGGKTIQMAVLKNLYESLGLSDVTTYIQSGNVLFNAANRDIRDLQTGIAGIIQTNSQLDVAVIIRTRLELRAIIEGNPFSGAGRTEFDKMHVTFLEEQPAPERLKNLNTTKDTADQWKLMNREIYLLCPDGYGRTVYHNSFFEKKLKVRATTRNWHTVNKLYESAADS